jgi:hypothetical protein
MKWNSLARGATRWWSAPARFPTTSLASLRKTVLSQYSRVNPWLQQESLRAQTEPADQVVLRTR